MVAKTDVDTIVLAIESYEAQTGHYPTTEQGLAALLDAIVSNIEKPQLKEPIIFRLPLDPWGNNYQYITPGKYNKHYDVWRNPKWFMAGVSTSSNKGLTG